MARVVKAALTPDRAEFLADGLGVLALFALLVAGLHLPIFG